MSIQYGFEVGTNQIGLPAAKQPDDVRLIKSRGTWNHDTGYSFTEEYQGGRREILRASHNPYYICGAQQFIIDEDPHDRSATMTVVFPHRNKFLAQRNLAQAETFKTTWTLQKVTEQIPLWRHPAYGDIRSLDINFPGFDDSSPRVQIGRVNEFQYLKYLTDLLDTWEQGYNSRLRRHFDLRLRGLVDPTVTGTTGHLDVSRTFGDSALATVARVPEEDDDGNITYSPQVVDPLLVYPQAEIYGRDEANRLSNLINNYIINYLNNRRTALLERNVLTNVTVIPPNTLYSGLQNIGNQLARTNSIIQLVVSDLNLILETRSFTPAGCVDITANKRALVRDLAREYRNTIWFIEPQTTKEVRNGSFEVRRSFVQRHFYEINTTVTPFWVHPNLR